MKKQDVIDMAESYIKRTGFKPGAIVVNKYNDKEIKNLLEVMEEVCGKDRLDLFKYIKSQIAKNVTNIEQFPVMGLRIVLSKEDKPIHLRRDSGHVGRIRPQGMKEAYMPVADITNSFYTIMRASLSFFDGITDDTPFINFTKEIATIMYKSSTGDGTWESECLPVMQKACDDFGQGSEKSQEFFKRFFMCMLDFYWHSKRLIPGSEDSRDRESFEKMMGLSSLIRTMPKDMRKDYMDHITSNGILPGSMENKARG